MATWGDVSLRGGVLKVTAATRQVARLRGLTSGNLAVLSRSSVTFSSAIILRFAGIYGPVRLMRAQAIKAGEKIVWDPEKWLNLIHVEDGATAVLAADERAALGITPGFPKQVRAYWPNTEEAVGTAA